jgi:16S rRNA processing protein RimM
LSSFDKIIPLGRILKPHGIKGELKILFYNEGSNSLKKNQIVFLNNLDNEIFKYKIERIFYFFKKNRIKFFDINTIEEGEKLRGYTLNILKSDLPKLNKDEYYLNDLIGYLLIDSSNKNYGIVSDVLAFPANNVLSVTMGNKEYLIPLIDDVVLEINHDNKKIIIDPIEGLFN